MRLRSALVFLIAAGAAHAADFDIQVDNFTAEGGLSSAVMKITNNTGRDAERIYIDCVFMDEAKKAIDIGKAVVDTLSAGQSTYEKTYIPSSEGVAFVACEVKKHR